MIEGVVRGLFLVEEHGLHGDKPAEPPCGRDDTVHEEELKLAHRRQLSPEAFAEVHEVRFAFAFDEALAA